MRVNDVIVVSGRFHRVDLVNECRARCVPVSQRVRVYEPKTGRNAGKQVIYACPLDPISISPNAELPIVGRWDGEKVVSREVAA